MKYSIYFLISVFIISTDAFASIPADDSEQLDIVNVEGHSDTSYTPYDLIGNHQSINKKSFDQSFVTLPNILEQQSGIEIQSIGGIGQYSSPSIRGSSGQQVLVFWDGLLINGLSGGSADLGNLNLSHAAKIDIYRSTAPVELSSSAVGGVIHIQSSTINPNQELNGQLSIMRGSYGTQQYSLMQHFNAGDSQWLIAGEYLAADNDFEYLEPNPTSNQNEPAYEPRYNNGSEQYHWLLKGQQTLTKGRLDLAIQSTHSEREISSKINFDSNQAQISTDNKNIQLRWQNYWSDNNHSELTGSLSDQTQLYDDRYSSIGLGTQLNEYLTEGKNIQFNHYYQLDNIKTVFTVRSQNEETKTDYKLLSDSELNAQCISGNGCETTYERQQYDIASRIQYSNNQNAFTLQLSRILLEDRNLSSQGSHEAYFGTTWSTGVSHQSTGGIEYYLTIGNQVRLPTTNELFGDRGLSLGNPDLNPETSLQKEFGLRYQGFNWDIQSSIYHRNVEQAIVAESDSRGVIRYSNLGETQHIGIEQSVNWQPIYALTVSANLTLQSNEIIKDDRFSYYEGKQVAGYSQFYTYLSARYEFHHWDITLSNKVETAGYYTNSNSLEKDRKNQWNFTLGKNINNWRISLDITDITDNAARDYPYYPEPGRMSFLRINTKW